MDTLRGDLTSAVRQMSRQPLLSSVIVLTLALGLGVNTAIFSVADAILLKSLPVRAPEQLVLFQWTSGPSPRVEYITGEFWRDPASRRVGAQAFPYPAFERFRNNTASSSLSEVFASARQGRANVTVGGASALAEVGLVSGNYYQALGVTARIGRTFSPADDDPGREIMGVISHDYWQRRFGGDPAIVGRPATLDGRPVTIIGVSAAGFSGTGPLGSAPDLVLPLSARATLEPTRPFLSHPNWYWLQIQGRLRPDATRDRAEAEMARLFAQPPSAKGDHQHLQLVPGDQGPTRARLVQTSPLLILSGVAGLMLFLACCSVAGLLAARTSSRSREMGIRLTLGASRARLVRQLLTESLLLALIGGLLGLVLAQWTKELVAAGLVEGRGLQVDLDRRVLVFMAAIAIATGVLAGIVPALRGTSADAVRDRLAPARRAFRLGPEQVLVIVQVAASLVLLIGASLLLRTLHNLTLVNTGFVQDELYLFKVQPVAKPSDGPTISQRVLESLQRVSGVDAAAMAEHHLIADNTDRVRVSIEGGPAATEVSEAYVNRVGGDFFRTMGMPMRQGRAIGTQDDAQAPSVTVVNEAFVRTFLGGEPALGRQVNGLTIVGVIADATYGDVREPAPPTMFTSALQGRGEPLSFQVRSRMSLSAVSAAIRQAVRDVDPEAVAYDITTPRQQIHESIRQERLLASVTTSFGALAFLLASLGLYGLTAFVVSRRGREIALRMAVGARSIDVLRLVTRDSLLLALIGNVLGFVGAFVLARFLERVLFGVAPFDPFSLAAAALLTTVGTLVACWIPGRRALRVDPAIALKAVA